MMNKQIDEIKETLVELARSWEERHGRRYYCDVAPENIVAAARALFEKCRLRLSTATAVDLRGSVEILYHFSVDAEGAVVSLRVSLPKECLEVGSLAPFMKAAEWIEREIHEMLGVEFVGHPDPRRLLLSDVWPEGNYPLRREGEVQT